MPEPTLGPPLDDPDADLPRTLRRAKEDRAREAWEREAREARERETREARDERAAMTRERFAKPPVDAPPAATVSRLDVPFVHLMLFLLKTVLAAIPALILLGVILWLMGQALETFYPEFVKMRVVIQFPN